MEQKEISLLKDKTNLLVLAMQFFFICVLWAVSFDANFLKDPCQIHWDYIIIITKPCSTHFFIISIEELVANIHFKLHYYSHFIV